MCEMSAVGKITLIFCFCTELHLSCKFVTFCSTVTDIGGIIESAGFRLLENMKAVTIAVSGTRKVACVVSTNDAVQISYFCGIDYGK